MQANGTARHPCRGGAVTTAGTKGPKLRPLRGLHTCWKAMGSTWGGSPGGVEPAALLGLRCFARLRSPEGVGNK